MSAYAANFDPLVRVYRALEVVAYGGDLERARFCLLDRLADRRSILVLGEGDGRALTRLVQIAPNARIHCIDSSRAMLDRARARLAGTAAMDRVTFVCADALTCEFSAGRYDAVVTLFFLDCFDAAQAEDIVRRVGSALSPDAVWLFADFVLPPHGIARLRARAWLGLLYAFFRWQTGLRTHELPPSENLILTAGFRRVAVQDFQWGLLRSAFFSRPALAEANQSN